MDKPNPKHVALLNEIASAVNNMPLPITSSNVCAYMKCVSDIDNARFVRDPDIYEYLLHLDATFENAGLLKVFQNITRQIRRVNAQDQF
jgi:hypothetical protein